MVEIGDRIRAMRKAAGLTQKALGEKLEVKPSTVSMYERGEREPVGEMLVKLSRVFGVSSDYLLGIGRDSDEITDVVKSFAESIRYDDNIMLDGSLLTQAERESVIEAIAVAASIALMNRGNDKRL